MRGFVGLRRGIFTALLLAALVLTALPPAWAAEGQRVLRVAFPQAEGFTMTAPDGSRYGLVVDFLDEIAKYTGWQYEYVDTEGDTMLDEYAAGAFDLMGGTYYADGFEEYFAYPDYNSGYSRLILLAGRDNATIKSYDLNTFNGKTIGVYERNRENIRRLEEYLTINDLDCTLRYYSYEELAVSGDLIPFLESGEVDLLLGNSADVGDRFYVAAAFESQPHYIVTTLGNQEVLDGLNMALGHIYDADPNFAEKLYEANFSTAVNGYTQLNGAERDYIAQKGTVTVAVPGEWHPMFCLDNQDNHDGLVPDLLKEIAAYSGLEFSYLRCASYAEALRSVQQGKADLLGFFTGTGEDAAALGLALTSPYVELDSILVRNKKSSYPAEGLTGAVMEGREMPEGIVAEEVRYYASTAKALDDVNSGKVDFFYGTSSQLEYVIQQENFTNIVQVTLVNESMEIGFAMPRPVQPELLTILNKAINSLSDAQKTAINGRNIVSIGESHISLSSILYGNPGLAVGVVAAFLLLVLLVVLLASRARLRAAAMRGELEKAEADSRAKSAFLSRMSHEIRTPMNAIVGLTDLTGQMDGLPEKARENLGKVKSSARYLLQLISDILDMSRIENGKMEIACEPFSVREMLTEVEEMMQAGAAERRLALAVETDVAHDVLKGDAVRLRQVILNLLSNAFKFTPDGGAVRVRVAEEASTEGSATLSVSVKDSGVGIDAGDQRRIFDSFVQLGSNGSKSQGTGLGLAISSHIVQSMGGELKLDSEPGRGSEFYFTVTLPRGRADELPSGEPEVQGKALLGGLHILVAEDNDLNAEIVAELLQTQGAAVSRAENGRIALARFEESTPGAFDAILMDIMMPEMNGLDAARAIRALPRPDAGTIPILAMTANTFQEDVEMAAAAGMTGFISKPVDVAYLYRTLRSAVREGAKPKPGADCAGGRAVLK